ncbi:hypothetical protein [Fibrivirga algicola]|nr:hypothetical protein [Fibrivirga algicola]
MFFSAALLVIGLTRCKQDALPAESSLLTHDPHLAQVNPAGVA